MKKKFYYENFERLLREKTDEYKMLPSKKVWHSIYNDLHPGKSWPSVSMSLFIIVILGILGYLNSSANKQNIILTATSETLKNISFVNNTSNTFIKTTDAVAIITGFSQNKEHQPNSFSKKPIITQPQAVFTSKNNIADQTVNYTPSLTSQLGLDLNNDQVSAGLLLAEKNKRNIDIANENEMMEKTIRENNFSNFVKKTSVFAGITEKADILIPNRELLFAKANYSSSFHPTIFEKKPDNFSLPKVKHNLSYTVYITPNVGFSRFSYNVKHQEITSSDNKSLNEAVKNLPSFGFEAGAGLSYSVNKRLLFRTGLQFNYTNYSISAFEITHPVVTTLMLNDYNNYPYLASHLSALSNTSGNKLDNYHSKTYQLSIPIGIDFRLLGNDQLAWYAGASIQPGYIFAGNSYLISADKTNYVADDGTYRRKLNVNTSIETYIAYKTKNDIQIQIGPQYRQQLISTYTNTLSIDEKLYHLGLKLGMVKPF